LIFFSLFIGRYPLTIVEVISVLGAKSGFSGFAPLPI